MTQTDSNAHFPHLFSPLRIGNLEVPNRFVVPALTTNFAETNGDVGDRLINYLEARAAGGFGLIVTENLGVHASGRVMPRMGMADTDERIPHLARLAKAVKGHGALLFGQISHAGRQTRSKITGQPLLAPSPIPCPLNREMPLELTEEQIEMLVDAFATAAFRLQQAGFDGVEIHGAHGYLVAAFLSNYANKRRDDFGGSLENRMRFLLKIIAFIHQKCGPDFPICVRLSVEEFVTDGLTPDETCKIAAALEAAGVQAISASVGTYESFNRLSMITGEDEGRWLPLARRVKHAVSIPVMGVGRLKRPEVAEQALARNDMDLAAFGRASLADPDLPAKARAGREDTTIFCIGCNICLGRSSRPQTICPVNPAVGDEARWRFTPTGKPLHLRVEGSSLASLTAAWVAAERGHSVELVLRPESFGGMQGWRSRVPGMQEYGETIEAAWIRAKNAGVRAVEPRESPADLVWRETGKLPLTAAILEIRPEAVPTSTILAREGLDDRDEKCVVFGSDIATTEAAIRLATAGCKTRLVTAMRDVAHDAHPGYREVSRNRLAALSVEVTTQADDWRDQLAAVEHGVLIVAGEITPQDATPVTTENDDAGTEIIDAYEAGAMTAGIYATADRALLL
ncbi:NADH:flavin oxidoreductase [Sulfitobacter sp. KE34]|uniref:oxidoreductase n=1 Tax=unclassified Sulfitobacter TaxID=196795 RepID=UPI001446A361|nr:MULTISPECIES: NADH:flavin oxidoreductase [unclassified Sulfitobacter]NKX40249.1 NADH:flavin oxidoreductase [Rhodobacteraceae bacterium R_SAG2]MDF3351620.1 NADH:flavin oxidoreductase [Sulfitobacter sp. KE12]MDF3355293.1 NADH:flavin oxidoreductase [Sulfitobacter sp. KE27]MDF3358941.1 NADH:flavin oxidoreductase [Sulfitobacter sp. KE33]MDF3366365.1 NADH:flavin oxidoreductase [Sulfitobacter sp. Ks34]